MTSIHNLGFPRIGEQRTLKIALEQYWQGLTGKGDFLQTCARIRSRNWKLQAEAGLDYLPVGDFSCYDHVLDTSLMFGVIPDRFNWTGGSVDLDLGFTMARGRAPSGQDVTACEMTKWFDTNYHYIVPEFVCDQVFKLSSEKLFDEVAEAQSMRLPVKPVILGPLSYLWLGKVKGQEFDKLSLLERLLPLYDEILTRLATLGIEWVQVDEPILALDIGVFWREAFAKAYGCLGQQQPKLMLTTYFGPLEDNLDLVCDLDIAALHIDGVRAIEELHVVADRIGPEQVLSVGCIDGRNIWRNNLRQTLATLKPLRVRLGNRLWLAPSCSLLHVPIDLQWETRMEPEVRSWLAFARQKLNELAVLKRALDEGDEDIIHELSRSDAAVQSRLSSSRVYCPEVRKRVQNMVDEMRQRRTPYQKRAVQQQAWLQLPAYPTTTIGSFPQTAEIRRVRRLFKTGEIEAGAYRRAMRDEIAQTIRFQEKMGLDILVHGEPERNDMVEYFGEHLDGFLFTQYGWVQSYGSRCVKPPIIYGDVVRSEPITVDWARYAQSLTDRPVKGMLTGPVTILNWSFVRDDQPRSDTCLQIALALRDEVLELEQAGIRVIQVDEAALREGLPLRKGGWKHYLDWAVKAFHLTVSGVADATQVHTHMCYSDFNNIITAIAQMDADVITIETSRSDMALLDVFESFNYPNAIGPGVYDIHSPNTPSIEHICSLISNAGRRIPKERLWINPDCGLKTRSWKEVEKALTVMVDAAKKLRADQ